MPTNPFRIIHMKLRMFSLILCRCMLIEGFPCFYDRKVSYQSHFAGFTNRRMKLEAIWNTDTLISLTNQCGDLQAENKAAAEAFGFTPYKNRFVREHEKNTFYESMERTGKFSGEIKMYKADGKSKLMKKFECNIL